MPKSQTAKIVYLIKSTNALISHCKCGTALIGAPAQLDCPWCGCGWLFVCASCRKAFAFARAEVVDMTWEQLAHRDLDGKWGRQPTAKEVKDWVAWMKLVLKGIQVGKEYVYIDGWVFTSDSKHLRFEGWHARHELATLPQVEALHDGSALGRTLGSERYWQDRRVENE